MAKVTLPNGVTVEGTAAQITEIAKTLGYPSTMFYSSSTQGLVAITGMAKPHLKNAVIKLYREWVEALSKTDDVTFLKRMEQGPADNAVLVAMLEEFGKRP